jgi:hypothetical protein
MHLTALSHWSRSIGTGGRHASEPVDAITGMRSTRPGFAPRAGRRTAVLKLEPIQRERTPYCFGMIPD